MGTAVGTFSARANHRIRLETQLAAQSISGNYSVVNWQLYAERTSSSSSYYLTAGGGGSVNIGGNVIGIGAWKYDFRSTAVYALGSGQVVIYHNADGTQAYGFSASISAPGSLGSASCSGSEGLPTIPRASVPTFSPNPVDAGTTVTINTNRASSGFTHTISYALGSASGTIGTGIGDSTTWTPPLSLLSQIPNSTTGLVSITTTTYSGATLIGTSTASLTLSAPASVVPDFTTITNSETITLVSTTVGAYVQSLSQLALAITGAVGAYGSTITSYKIEVAGQTINAVSGTTTPINASGTVPIVGTVTDSRNRTVTKTVNVTVLPYVPPAIDSSAFLVRRSDFAGTLQEEGTYIRADIKAAVQSLIVGGTQKNSLTYKIYTRQRGTEPWTLKKTVTPLAVTFNNFDTVGTYAVENAWDVQVTVSDKFGTAVIQSTVATATIFMHWGPGLGLGKFWEQGGLDVGGQIYQNSGKLVLDTGSSATSAQLNAGTSQATYVSPLGLAERMIIGTVDPNWRTGLPSVTLSTGAVVTAHISVDVSPGDSVVLNKIGSLYYIVAVDLASTSAVKRMILTPLNGWVWYNKYIQTAGPSFAPPMVARTGAGHVFVDGLLMAGISGFITSVVAAGTVLVTLPAWARPLADIPVTSWSGSGNIHIGLIVKTTGDIVLEYAVAANSLVSLSNIRYNNDSALVRNALTLTSPWLAYGSGSIGTTAAPTWAVDSAGRAVIEGVVKTATSASAITTVPAGGRWSGATSLRSIYSQVVASRFGRVNTTVPGVIETGAAGIQTAQSIYMNHLPDSSASQWQTLIYSQGSNYGGWDTLALTQLNDGTAMLKGLTTGMGLAAIQVPQAAAPKYALIFAVDATDQPGRLDVYPSGIVAANGGTNSFISLAGIEWLPNPAGSSV
jgi:hypothetical protein